MSTAQKVILLVSSASDHPEVRANLWRCQWIVGFQCLLLSRDKFLSLGWALDLRENFERCLCLSCVLGQSTGSQQQKEGAPVHKGCAVRAKNRRLFPTFNLPGSFSLVLNGRDFENSALEPHGLAVHPVNHTTEPCRSFSGPLSSPFLHFHRQNALLQH